MPRIQILLGTTSQFNMILRSAFWLKIEMNVGDHFRITGDALKNWIVAQFQDSLAVGILWMVGLYILGVPWAPFWAFLAAVLQFVPHLGAVLGMVGPVLAATI